MYLIALEDDVGVGIGQLSEKLDLYAVNMFSDS